jgi:hypothetical protein
MADYSFSPQFANLSGLQPLPALDVTRGAALQFQPLQAIQIQSSRPELVAEGIAGAVSNIAQGALSGITAKYEKQEEKDKETRKFAQELLLEEAKQKTKNKQFLDELKLKIASEHGLEADVDERMAAVDEAAERLFGANPTGNVVETKPKPQKPIIDTEVDTSSDTYGKRDLSPADAVFVPTGTPEEQSKAITNQVGLPINIAEPTPEAATIQQPSPQVVTAPSGFQSVSTQRNQPPALAGSPTQPTAAPSPTPVLGGMEASVIKEDKESGEQIGSYKIPKQPDNPAAPRNTGGFEFMPSDYSYAFDAAGKIRTPYWDIVVVQNPKTHKWSLQPKDTSADVKTNENEAKRIGISAEQLTLQKQDTRRAQEKFDVERLDQQRKIIRDDATYRNKIKNNITEGTKNIELIDRAINAIQDNPELVGVISKYYTDEKKIPLTPITYEEAAVIAQNYFGVTKYLDKVQKVQDIAAQINSVARNVGWSKFAEMKELSATGSAGVGALSNDERQSLEQTQGAIDKGLSPELNLDTLNRLKNAATKTIANAYGEIRQIDPKFPNPISEGIYYSYTNKIKEIDSALKNATPAQKKSRNYMNAIDRLESLYKTYEIMREFRPDLTPIEEIK